MQLIDVYGRLITWYCSYKLDQIVAVTLFIYVCRALEDLDSLLLHAIRNDPTASVGSMKNKISIALGALDRCSISPHLHKPFCHKYAVNLFGFRLLIPVLDTNSHTSQSSSVSNIFPINP